MKSYYTHLSSRLEFGETNDIKRKPILRSSAIFPVLKNPNLTTRILFLGYWLIKRNIPEVHLLITLRAQSGEILLRKSNIISTVQAFSIELDSLLKELNYTNQNFTGSIEFEFQTTRDMVFPYPALVLEYYGNQFDTCVHTTQRIYNDFEDLIENEQFSVPESGFDIYCDNDLEPFMAFVNGPLQNKEGKITYAITNHKSEKFSGSFNIGKILPYETKFIKFRDYIENLDNFLDNNSGSISLTHNFAGFYPRLLVGNFQSSFQSVSFTHSYYDCSNCNNETDYWNRLDSNLYDSSVYVPLFYQNDFYTNLIVYPNLPHSKFNIHLIFYDKDGNEISSIKNFLHIDSIHSKLFKINFNEVITAHKLTGSTSVHIITEFEDKIPSRIKFGLDVGISKLKSKLPCNICFNAKVGNPSVLSKPGSFHWAPLFFNDSLITVGNFSTVKNYQQNAHLEIKFYRETDSDTITREYSLKPNSELRLNIDGEVRNFLKGQDGWITIKSDNPFIQGFYFNFHSTGSVAGDHFF